MRKNSSLKLIFILLFTISFISSTTAIPISINFKETTQTIPSDGLMDSAWPMFGHDVKHTGRSPYAPAWNWPVVKWKFKMTHMTTSSPAIDENGILYIGAKNSPDSFFAISPNGTELWQYNADDIVWSSPAIDASGVIYFGSNDGGLHALYPNGTRKWRANLDRWVFSSPTIDIDGTIYVGTTENNFFAVNPNGTIKWRFEAGYKIYSSPAIDDSGIIYFGSHDEFLYALYPNCTLKWKFGTDGEIKSPPAIGSDGTIYFCSWDSRLYAVNPDGTLKWSRSTGGGTAAETSPSFDNEGNIIVGSYNGKIHSYSPEGNKNWEYLTSDWVISSAAIDKNGMIYIGSMNGRFYSFNPSGTLRWSISLGDRIESSPIIGDDGTIYVAAQFQPSGGNSSYSYLYALDGINNTPPTIPVIDGPLEGKINEPHTYSAVSSDVDGHNISYFFDWGDGSNSGWLGPFPSGIECETSHTWTTKGDYTIRVKARDELGMESEDWGTLEVEIPHGQFSFLSFLIQRIHQRIENSKTIQNTVQHSLPYTTLIDSNNPLYYARTNEYARSRNTEI